MVSTDAKDYLCEETFKSLLRWICWNMPSHFDISDSWSSISSELKRILIIKGEKIKTENVLR